jgi:hypothetical protein
MSAKKTIGWVLRDASTPSDPVASASGATPARPQRPGAGSTAPPAGGKCPPSWTRRWQKAERRRGVSRLKASPLRRSCGSWRSASRERRDRRRPPGHQAGDPVTARHERSRSRAHAELHWRTWRSARPGPSVRPTIALRGSSCRGSATSNMPSVRRWKLSHHHHRSRTGARWSMRCGARSSRTMSRSRIRRAPISEVVILPHKPQRSPAPRARGKRVPLHPSAGIGAGFQF